MNDLSSFLSSNLHPANDSNEEHNQNFTNFSNIEFDLTASSNHYYQNHTIPIQQDSLSISHQAHFSPNIDFFSNSQIHSVQKLPESTFEANYDLDSSNNQTYKNFSLNPVYSPSCTGNFLFKFSMFNLVLKFFLKK